MDTGACSRTGRGARYVLAGPNTQEDEVVQRIWGVDRCSAIFLYKFDLRAMARTKASYWTICKTISR